MNIKYYHQGHILLAINRPLINGTKEHTNLIDSDYVSSVFFILRPVLSDFCYPFHVKMT